MSNDRADAPKAPVLPVPSPALSEVEGVAEGSSSKGNILIVGVLRASCA
jgi:hypothetical protein